MSVMQAIVCAERWVAEGHLELRTAFSRLADPPRHQGGADSPARGEADPPSSQGGADPPARGEGGSKVYVQTLLREDRALVWALIGQQGAHVYVCGDARRMAHDVHCALLYIVGEGAGGLDPAEAERFLTQLERDGRYQKDCWIT